MKTVCAWCGVVIRDGEPDPSGLVSHGMCHSCMVATGVPVDVMCSWCGRPIVGDEADRGMCDRCHGRMEARLADENAMRREARIADQQEEVWARATLYLAPRSVLETIAEGTSLDVARKVAREILEEGR